MCGVLAAGAALLGGDPFSAVWAGLIAVFAGLAAYDFHTSPRLSRWLLIRVVIVMLIVLTLYRILFTFASPT